jgi:hypothetical protein
MPRSRSGDSFGSILDEIRAQLTVSRKSFVPGGGYVVDRDNLTNLLNRAVAALPEEIEQANLVVGNQKAIQTKADREYTERIQSAKDEETRIRREADEYAQHVRADAQAQAEAYYKQKAQEGDTYYMQAQAQADQIVENAHAHAAQLVEEEEVMERAKVESEELRERVCAEMEAFCHQTYQYLDETIAEMDEAFGQRQVELRRLRQNIHMRSQETIHFE